MSTATPSCRASTWWAIPAPPALCGATAAPYLLRSAKDSVLLDGISAASCYSLSSASMPNLPLLTGIGQAISAALAGPLTQQSLAATCLRSRRSSVLFGGWVVLELMVVVGWRC